MFEYFHGDYPVFVLMSGCRMCPMQFILVLLTKCQMLVCIIV